MTAVSVIIPFYNVKEYLPRFVSSLQTQTFKDFETIFVDYASIDGGIRRLCELAGGDPRLRILSHKDNMGAGAARNTGIRAATGETLCFADPDDWIKREKSLSATTYSAEHYADYIRCADVFYDEARSNRHTALGDHFCNGYLACYIPHFLWQYTQRKSAEEDARKLAGAAGEVCARHGVFKRLVDKDGHIPAHYAGLSMLWHALKDESPFMAQRLANGQNAAILRFQLAGYDSTRRQEPQLPALFEKFDHEQGLLRAIYQFCDDQPKETYTHGGLPLQPAFAKNRLEYKTADFTIYERILWLRVPQKPDGKLELHVAGQDAGLNLTPEAVRKAFTSPTLDNLNFPPEIRALLRLAQNYAVREAFQNAWLFIDKDTEADDNAEHLYRWVMRNKPEIKAHFVLNESSRDWPRLQTAGFRLIPHGGMEHKALFILCKRLISSQMDRYIFSVIEEEEYFADLRRSKFVCLQHGVTKDDISIWLNPAPIDVLVTTHAESRSIVEDGSPYLITAKEVCPAGMPRYDQLPVPAEIEKNIFIMSTWRADLVGSWDGRGQKRKFNSNFYSSQYVKIWSEVFNSPQFQEIIERHGYQTIFFAHPCSEDYLEGLPFPSFVRKRSKSHGSIQEMMKKSSMMITDFTSVAFDMAYMKRPIIYYQAKNKESYAKRQSWASGYINYETMGFGPVCRDVNELCAALERTLCEDCAMAKMYEERVDNTFMHRDARCCEHVFEFIAPKPVSRQARCLRRKGIWQ